MTTHEAEFASKVRSYLDHGTGSLKQGTAYRLQLARQAALARLGEPEPVIASELVLAGAGHGRAAGRSFWTSAKLWLGIALIAAASLGYHQWQAYQQASDLADTDAALLTSDLPIDAYLDNGFLNWLKHGDDP